MGNLVRTPDGRVWEVPSMGEDFAIGEDDYYFGEDYAIGEDDDDDDEFYGEDDMYFGRKRRGRKGRRRLKNAALARSAGGFAARSKGASWGGRLPLPLGPVTVTASGTQTITAQPQNAIKVEQLVITSGNASLFNILEVSVGTENQFVQSGTINGDIFSSASQRPVGLKGSTANPGNIITVRVTNLDTVNAQIFGGAIIGPVIRSYG